MKAEPRVPEQLKLRFETPSKIRSFESSLGLPPLRDYQAELLGEAVENNIIVSLPTGTGKTLIGLYLMEIFAKRGKKTLFLCPSVALAKQQYERLPVEEGSKKLITGEKKRERKDYEGQFIFGTPQSILNDLVDGIISKGEFSAIVFDECHKAVGCYAFVKIAKGFEGRVLGLTASLGSKKEKILEICTNLNARKMLHKDGEEVLSFVGSATVVPHFVGFPEDFLRSIGVLRANLRALEQALDFELERRGVKRDKGKRGLQELERKLSKGGWDFKDARNAYWRFRWMSELVDKLERYSISEFLLLYEKLKEKTSANTKYIIRHAIPEDVLEFLAKTRDLGMEHPKVTALMSHLEDGLKTIVFTTYRDNANVIGRELSSYGISHGILLGKGKGIKATDQAEAIRNFRESKFQVLLSTSVGEEGLDLPSVKRVVFYDEVPRAVRSIQRKGRTARISEGEVVQLIARNTLDEKYFFISRNKERAMAKRIAEVNSFLQRKRLNSRL